MRFVQIFACADFYQSEKCYLCIFKMCNIVENNILSLIRKRASYIIFKNIMHECASVVYKKITRVI